MAGDAHREYVWSSSVMERFSSKVKISCSSSTKSQHNLLSFLATAQALRIELLPITWQSARPQLGGGATSSINEALADLHTSFIFKRIRGSEKREESNEGIFGVFTNEIKILCSPSIRENQHFAQLQGICWDIENDGRVWPVLLFEKSHLGDLCSFMDTPAGQNLRIDERLKICIDIGKALSALHGCGESREAQSMKLTSKLTQVDIIHGDLKPQNLLVFKNQAGDYIIKVIDFGYSNRYLNNSASIQIPIS